MPLTAVELCSTALLKIGALPIESFDAPTTEARLARLFYGPLLDSLLGGYPWSFSLTQARLVPDGAAAPGDFGHVHFLPGDMLRAISADAGAYRVMGRRLHASTSPVVLTYQRRPAEADLPPYFVQVLINRLAAEFCLPLTESASRAEYLMRLAGAELKAARLVDSQQSTPAAVEDFTLIRARG
ncbi:MAG: hypothetical protein KDG89_12640 [Geminicoccaceae bacterium]|nr:hypothetical protein [Geminicoccaceae bacterium]